ncbi:MAG: CdaR family transcriptional regulator [Christensenellales bacterium]
MASKTISNKNAPISINGDMASMIIDRVKKTINYDINIMDENGVIIASSNPNRVGNFHELAYQILSTYSDTLETSDDDEFIGTKNGINTIIKFKGFRVGVLGITGEPDKVRLFIHILKLTVEMMVEREFELHELTLRNSQRSLFENGLMQGSRTEVELIRWATELSIDRSVYRIPIWVKISHELPLTYKSMLLGIISSNKYYTEQDIILQWKDHGLVIFKMMPCDKDKYCEYKDIVCSFLEEFLRKLDSLGLQTQAYVGSFCKRLDKYHEAYKRALWVFGNCSQAKCKVEFFYDYVDEWAKSFIPIQEMHDIYSYFIAESNKKSIEQMIEMEASLSKHNYNFERASQELYIHKNTLFLWMNNLKKMYGINPTKRPSDRSFWGLLCYYLKSQTPAKHPTEP